MPTLLRHAVERSTSAVDRSMAIVLRNLFREQSALLTIGRFEDRAHARGAAERAPYTKRSIRFGANG